MDGVGFDHFPNNGTLRYIRFKAKQIAGKYGFHYDELEDIQQTLIAECLERMERFDSRRSNSETFARILIARGIATIIESQKARCRDYRLCQRSLDTPCNSVDSRSADFAGNITEGDDHVPASCRPGAFEQSILLKCDVDRAVAALRPELQKVCRLLMVIDRVGEVAMAAGISRATLHRKMRAIRTQFIQARISDYSSEAATISAAFVQARPSDRWPEAS